MSSLLFDLLAFLKIKKIRLGTVAITAMISNGRRFKPAFAKRDKEQKMIDLRGISSNWFKNQFCPSTMLSTVDYELRSRRVMGLWKDRKISQH
jgi:hypothetical protein